jgi:hypothetical protein
MGRPARLVAALPDYRRFFQVFVEQPPGLFAFHISFR